ncbi:MAG: hypothetical protein AVDCRST_MAG41-3582, partial [uncultured Corynebacteriales bacterium]
AQVEGPKARCVHPAHGCAAVAIPCDEEEGAEPDLVPGADADPDDPGPGLHLGLLHRRRAHSGDAGPRFVELRGRLRPHGDRPLHGRALAL